MTINIIDLYTSLLNAAGLDVTSDGFVRAIGHDGKWVTATKNKKQLVVPIKSQLQSPHFEHQMVFHPLSENGLQNESEVLAFYRHLLVARVNAVIGTLALDLLNLAASDKRHAALHPDQSEFLKLVPDVTERTVDDWMKLCRAMPATQVKQALVSIFLKKSGVLHGKSFRRVASVSFPFYDELLAWRETDKSKKAEREAGHKPTKSAKAEGSKPGHSIYDVVIREKDRDPLIALMEYLIPQIDESGAHNRGSNSTIAAGLDALMKSFQAIAGHLNGIIDLFSPAIEGLDKLRFNSDWVEAFENLDVMWPQIRELVVASQPDVQEPPAPAAPTPVAAAPYQAPPVPEQRKPLPWEAAPPPAPAATAPLAWAPGQGMYPVYTPTPAQHQQPAAAASGNGTSISSIMAANPVYPPQGYPQPGYPQGGYPPPGYPPPPGYGYGPQQGYAPPAQYYNPPQPQQHGNMPWHHMQTGGQGGRRY